MKFRLAYPRVFFVAASIFTVVLSAAPASAQFNQDIMMKWMNVTVVHYSVVGDFEREVMVIDSGTNGLATVKDHVEIGFDWDVTQAKLVGAPKITDARTQVGGIRNGAKGCRPPTVSGEFEYSTIESIVDGNAGQLMMKVRTDYPAANMTVACTGGNQAVAAHITRTQKEFPVPGIMMLAMGGAMTGDNLRVSKDAKSFIIKQDGWTYVYTPTKVR